jgi:hypothetical protein
MSECGTKPECAEIADRAVRKTFAILGVDVDKPESVEEFRQDLRFGKKLRRIADHGTLAFFGAVALAIAGSIWIGITSLLGGDPK